MFYTYRSTTDKLGDALTAIAEAGDTIVQPTHVGGRDWVIVCRKGREHGFAEALSEQLQELLAAQVDRSAIADAISRGAERGSKA